jgi:hypothetical protein
MIKMFHPSSSALLVAGALLLGDSFPIREISAFTSPLKATSTRKPWTTSSNPIRAQNKGFMSANPATSDAAGHDEAEEAFNVAADGVATRESTKAFFEETAQLCQERNIAFDKVKNARDLASVRNSPIKANRIFRTGKLSDCSANDIEMAFKESTDKEGALKIRTIIDLRSPTELKEDEELHRRDVFGKFTTMDWVEGKRSKYISNSGKASDSKGHTEERGMNSPTHTIRRKLRKSKGGDMVEEFCFPGRGPDPRAVGTLEALATANPGTPAARGPGLGLRLRSRHNEQLTKNCNGLHLAGVSSIAGAINFIVTIYNMRCRGML